MTVSARPKAIPVNTYSDYGGDGSYTLPSSSGNMNGTQSIQGSDSTKSNYNTNSTDEDGDWTEGGTSALRLGQRLFLRRLRHASGSFTGNFNGVAITGNAKALPAAAHSPNTTSAKTSLTTTRLGRRTAATVSTTRMIRPTPPSMAAEPTIRRMARMRLRKTSAARWSGSGR